MSQLEYKTVESILDLISGNWYAAPSWRENWRKQINKACGRVPGMLLFSLAELFIQQTSSQYMPPFRNALRNLLGKNMENMYIQVY